MARAILSTCSTTYKKYKYKPALCIVQFPLLRILGCAMCIVKFGLCNVDCAAHYKFCWIVQYAAFPNMHFLTICNAQFCLYYRVCWFANASDAPSVEIGEGVSWMD